ASGAGGRRAGVRDGRLLPVADRPGARNHPQPGRCPKIPRSVKESPMNRRQFLTGFSAAAALGGRSAAHAADCGCTPLLAAAQSPAAPAGWPAPRLKITNVKAIGVSLTPDSDRPYVFVKIETDQGVVGWGEATLEGKAGAVLACVNDFRDFLIGQDPLRVEHHWQS